MALDGPLVTGRPLRRQVASGGIGYSRPKSMRDGTVLVATILAATPAWLMAAAPARADERVTPKPPPLYVEYVSYGAAFTAYVLADAGAGCPSSVPCIYGGGGGLALRGGFRWPGPWYLGGAYQVSTTDSANIYRLATLQELRVEMRYSFDMGFRSVPYLTWGAGGVAYGDEWGVETGGASVFGGVGVDLQLSRVALLGVGVRCQPMVFAGFVDTAGFERPGALAQFVALELELQIRTEVSER
ncbi:MAG: hypothetical protein EXR75_03725 [Myxococcales bacterium]|nr:hypothetical protein [Myxococcales bacterium]